MKFVFQKTKSRLATVMICFDAGARAEGKEFSPGIAHMLEHMIFKGTQKMGYLDIPVQIASLGGSVNAYTSLEQVVYYITAPVENLEAVMDILSDMVFHSTFPEEEFLKEREVVMEECAASNDSIDSFVYENFINNYMHDRAKLPVIGTMESIAGFTRDEVVSFYKKNYTLNNCIVGVVANKKKQDVEALVEKYISKPDGIFVGQKVKKNKKKPKPLVTVTKDDIQHAYVYMAYKLVDADKKKEAIYDIFFEIFGMGMDSRLFTEVREKRGLCYSIGGGTYFTRDTPSILIHSSTRPERVEELVSVIKQEVDRIKEGGVTAEELSRAKNKWIASHYSQVESGRGMLKDSLNRAFYKSIPLKSVEKSVDAVTEQDMIDIANEIFNHDMLQVYVCKATQAA